MYIDVYIHNRHIYMYIYIYIIIYYYIYIHTYIHTYTGVESDGGGPDLVDHVVPGMVGGAREAAGLRARRSIKRARTLMVLPLQAPLHPEAGTRSGAK